MKSHTLPHQDWTIALAQLINTAEDGDELVVSTQAQKELAERAMKRLGRVGLTIVVKA